MNTDKLRSLFEASTDKYGDAKKIGVSYESMRKILAGSDPKVSTLEKIARFYNVPVGYFFDEAEADGRSTLEIQRLKGQIEGMQNTLEKIISSIKGLVPEKVTKGKKNKQA